MGVRDPVIRVFEIHRDWLRSRYCDVPGCWCRMVTVSHLRTAANAGTSLKPGDFFAVTMCGDGTTGHHGEYGRIGHGPFCEKYGIDLWAICRRCVFQSPDVEMRESFLKQPAHLRVLLGA